MFRSQKEAYMRLMAIILIFVATSVAWVILASSVMWRSENLDSSLRQRVERLWGTAQRQVAPRAYARYRRQKAPSRAPQGAREGLYPSREWESCWQAAPRKATRRSRI